MRECKSGEAILNDAWSVDLDQHFQHFMDVVGLKENYFRKDQPENDEDEPFGGYDTNQLVNQLDKIDLTSTPAQISNNTEKEPTQEAETKKEPVN